MWSEIIKRLEDGFQVADLEWAARELVKSAIDELPGSDGKAKAEWVRNKLYELVEQYDHLVPLVGQWADIPLVDLAQRELVNYVVKHTIATIIEWAYIKEVAEGSIAVKLS